MEYTVVYASFKRKYAEIIAKQLGGTLWYTPHSGWEVRVYKEAA